MPKREELQSEATRKRFEKFIRKNERGCWMWQGGRDRDGYGQFRFNTDLYRTHRFSYMLYVGEPEPGMDVDHKCANWPGIDKIEQRACVNPDHLEVVTHAENMRRQREGIVRPPWVEDEDEEEGSGGKKYTPRYRKTTAQEVMEWAKELIEERGWTPAPPYGVELLEGAPWRAYVDDIEHGKLSKDDKNALLALFLVVTEFGVERNISAPVVLGSSPLTMVKWNSNPDWKADWEAARKRGVEYKYNMSENVSLEAIESRAPDADLKHAIRTLEVINKRADDRATRKRRANAPNSGNQLGSGNTYVFIGNEKAHEAIAEKVWETTARDVTDEDEDRPALPPPDEWDEDFEDE